VVGSGPLAEEKVRGLLDVGAAVRQVESYTPGDLDGVCLAIVCSQPKEIVDAVWTEARQRGILVNTVDDVAHCDFIAPSIVRRGDLAIAISTGGRAPALAVRLRQKLEREVGEEHARFLALAGTVRTALAARRPDFNERRELWYRLVDSDVLDLLRQGDEDGATRRFEEILGVAPHPPDPPLPSPPFHRERGENGTSERTTGDGWGLPSPGGWEGMGEGPGVRGA
jgi:siroheme synthase-like protein